MLDHQAKLAAEQNAAGSPPPDPQLNIRLIGEVRRPAEPSPPKRKQRTKKPVQAKLLD
jgi:hypothetical protein